MLAADNRIFDGVRNQDFPGASTKGGVWRTSQAEMPPPGVSLPGPFVTQPSSGPPGGHALAVVPPLTVAKFEKRVLYKYGLAQVGIGDLFWFPPFFTSPFLLR